MTHAELDDRLGELLLAYNVIPAGHLERARKYQATKGSTLPGALCDLHVVPQDTLAFAPRRADRRARRRSVA